MQTDLYDGSHRSVKQARKDLKYTNHSGKLHYQMRTSMQATRDWQIKNKMFLAMLTKTEGSAQAGNEKASKTGIH